MSKLGAFCEFWSEGSNYPQISHRKRLSPRNQSFAIDAKTVDQARPDIIGQNVPYGVGAALCIVSRAAEIGSIRRHDEAYSAPGTGIDK